MAKHIKCEQEDCNQVAIHIMYWPGKQRAYICDNHAFKAMEVAHVLGIYVPLAPINYEEEEK